MKLVIVESPAKAKTINKYLGNDFKVIASFGHIRDLPSKNGSVVPEENFAMKYEISAKSEKHVAEIAKAAKSADDIYLATDPDREGESISWHISEILKEKNVLKPTAGFKRIAFNEITKKAVNAAMQNPRQIDVNLVNAQQARRALDYLVGFTLSPLLWRKLPGCKSAGRVQSVALRLICEREEEIEQFITKEYWDILLEMLNSKNEAFTARLTHVNGEKLEKFSVSNKAQAEEIAKRLGENNFQVASIEKKQQRRNPPPPFITSSLQQEAARKLGFSAKKTMQIAQKLYEGIDIKGETIGLITYMRTDGVSLSEDAIEAVRSFIGSNFGQSYSPASSRVYKSKAKNAQEAHEAIRPTDISITPDSIKNELENDFHKLYELIWKRTVACQMESVVIDIVAAQIDTLDKKFSARAVGSNIAFDGFYKLYREGIDDEQEEENKLLPSLNEGEKVIAKDVKPQQHFTEPPPRYTEASLVKKLEELGIGRPSTYATILSVLQDRSYVSLVKKRFVPEERGRFVTSFLVGFFRKYVEYDFTAKLEDELDEIAEGKIEWHSLLNQFWQGFNSNITEVGHRKITDVINYLEESLANHLFGKASNDNNRSCTLCGTGKLSLKLGKFGAFLACSNYPECKFTKQITKEEAEEAEVTKEDANNKLLGEHAGQDVFLKKGPYGWYIQLGEQHSKLDKPKRAPLPPGINHTQIDLNVAIKLLSLPLEIGKHPDNNEIIILGVGKFGPYLKYQGQFVSVPKNIDPFSVDLEKAVHILASKAADKSAKKDGKVKKEK